MKKGELIVAIRTVYKWRRVFLQTAIVHLRQRQSGRRIVLVAAIHVGRREYYEAINARIVEHERSGGVVLYEGLGSLSEHEVIQLPPRERAIYRALAPLHELYGAFADSLGLIFQGDAIHYDRRRWVNADLSLQELLRRWADSGAPLLPLGVAGAPEVSVPNNRLSRGIAGLMLLETPLMLAAVMRLRGHIPALGGLMELLLSDRNRAALDALDITATTRDALILYGAGHVPGLIEGLERRGFRETQRTWLTAFTQRQPWTTLMDALSGPVAGGRRT